MNLPKLLEQLKTDEGWSAEAYTDSLGYWTIGYGFLIDGRKGGYLPKVVGEFWLERLVIDKWESLIKALPWVEEQPEEIQLALANMCYQMGLNGLLKFKGMLDALQGGMREKAANEALDSAWAQQTPFRARRVAALIRG